MMGGLLIHGLRCGPMLFVNNMPTVYGIFAALLIAKLRHGGVPDLRHPAVCADPAHPRYVLTPS